MKAETSPTCKASHGCTRGKPRQLRNIHSEMARDYQQAVPLMVVAVTERTLMTIRTKHVLHIVFKKTA